MHLYFAGGQCGLSLPVAPRHCLSPGPGASAHAVGAEIANVRTASSPTMTLFGLLMRHLLSLFRSYRTGVTAPKEHTTFSTDSEDPGFYGCDVDGASDVRPVRELECVECGRVSRE